MTTIQRTLSILAMAAFVGLACNTTDAMARDNNHDKHHNKQVVHVERKVVKTNLRGHNKTVVKQVVRNAPNRHVVHHRAPHHVAHHYAPSPFGLSFSNGYVSVSLPGIHIR